MTRINVVPVQELQREHLVVEYKEIVRVFALARAAQYELHKKKIPNEYTLGTGHVLYFYDKLKYITERYNSLCTEMTYEERIIVKILSLPFGVALAVTLCFAFVSTALSIAVSLMIKVNVSLLFISLIMGFTVVRLTYFIITGK